MIIKMNNDILIYDLETKTFGKPNPEKDILRVFGCYSYKTNKHYLLTKKEDIQKIVNSHKFLIGFNNEKYDNPILERFGVSIKYKIIVDLMKILINRAGSMKIKQGMLKDVLMKYNLDYITRILGLVDDNTAKGELDYNILKKDMWTEEERKQIKEYTIRDLDITKKLYEWLEDYFEPFKHYIQEKDIEKKVYLTASIPKVVYKAICKAMKWGEEYGGRDDEDSISGGYVAYPSDEKVEGDLYCLDYNSLYPHIMMQCNLFGRRKGGEISDRELWYGGNKWKDIQGEYYADKITSVGALFKQWYGDRVEYKKKKDRREYSLKIFLNIGYGVLNSAYYTKVYDMIAGGDCTRIGRQWTKYARKVFRDAGYKVVYTDTDSVYILDVFKDKKRMLEVKDKKASVPFPQKTFDMGIDDEITHMFFFKGGSKVDKDEELDSDDFLNKGKGFMKKNYIYIKKVLDDNNNDTGKRELVIKNLGIKKKSNSALSRKIFWDILVPKIIETGNCKFKKSYIQNIILELLEKDIKLAASRYNVGNKTDYIKSPNGIYMQITQKYGEGIHFLIPNTKGVGVGKGKSYCTMEEFKLHKMNISNINLDSVWRELNYFIAPIVTKSIFDY